MHDHFDGTGGVREKISFSDSPNKHTHTYKEDVFEFVIRLIIMKHNGRHDSISMCNDFTYDLNNFPFQLNLTKYIFLILIPKMSMFN